MFKEDASTVTNVLGQGFKEPATFYVVSGITDLTHVSKTLECKLTRLFGWHTRFHVSFSLKFNVKLHLAIYFGNDLLASKQSAHAIAKSFEPLHMSNLVCFHTAWRTLAIASTSLSQLAS